VNVYVDTDAVIQWEKGDFDLPAWLEQRPDDTAMVPATVWRQLLYGTFAWEAQRAQKRRRMLAALQMPVASFSRRHAARAAQIAADLKQAPIGFADCQIAASAIEDHSELLTFNQEHFARVTGLRLAKARR